MRTLIAAFVLAASLTSPTAASSAATTAATTAGTAGDDTLHGGRGADVLRGLKGADHLNGRRGADRLYGGRGDDVLTDFLDVGTGEAPSTTRDVYRAGPGDDTLYVGHRDVVHAGRGADHVWAFYVGDGDVIDCGAGDHDVLHLHEDLDGLATRGCEKIVIRVAG